MTTSFPEFMFAEISSFLGKCPESDLLRKYCGNTTVRDDIKGSTYRNGVLHSYDDKPARITYERFAVWYKNGVIHRDNDLPAYIDLKYTHSMKWYKNGKLHREGDLPAYIEDGRNIWYNNGVIHRDNDLPAIIDGKTQNWYVKGLIHRDNDLPAIIEYEFLTYTHPPEYKLTVSWFRNGKLHRDNDRPATIIGKEEYVLPFLDNTIYNITDPWEKHYFETWDAPFKYVNIHQHWYKDGVRHRDCDKPAIRHNTGYAVWYKNGEKHRDDPDKPICISGNQAYWIVDGKEVGGGGHGSMPDHRWF